MTIKQAIKEYQAARIDELLAGDRATFERGRAAGAAEERERLAREAADTRDSMPADDWPYTNSFWNEVAKWLRSQETAPIAASPAQPGQQS